MRSGKNATIGHLRTALRVGLTIGLSMVALLGVSGQAFADQSPSDTYSYSCAYTGEVFSVRTSADIAAVDEYCANAQAAASVDDNYVGSSSYYENKRILKKSYDDMFKAKADAAKAGWD